MRENSKIFLQSSAAPGILADPLDEGEGHGPQVFETHMEDSIYCGMHQVQFLRAAFGNCDDIIDVPIVKADPFQADTELCNEEELRGKIVLVQRGSSSGEACSFVAKALRVESAGAVAMVLVNTEDSMISPGDSAREGGGVNIPVVGVRSGDLLYLSDPELSEKVSLTFKPIAPLTTQQRRHLRALSSIWDREGRLCELELDESAASESVLASVDDLLTVHQLVRLRITGDDEGTQVVSLQTLEDMIDVATVIADNLGGTVVHITDKTILLFRQGNGDDAICLPQDGEVSELEMDFGEMAGTISMLDFQID